MPSSVLGQLRVVLAANVAQFSRDMQKAGSVLGRFVKANKAAFNAISVASGAVLAAIAAVGAGIVALAARGADVAKISDSFDGLTRAAGLSGDALLNLTRKATSGLITDLQAMEAANKALLLGLPVTEQGFADMAKTATQLGRAMGQDAGKSLDDLITALGRASPLILDNLGLTVKVGEANEAYAAKLGKSTKALTEAEKKMAFFSAAMDAARVKQLELGDLTLTLGDHFRIAQVTLSNFLDSFGLAIAQSPVLGAAFEQIGLLIQDVFGANSQQTIDALVGHIERIALGFIPVGDAILRVATLFLDFVSVLQEGTAFVFDLVAAQAELAAQLPLVGGMFESTATDLGKLGDGARESAARTQGLSDSLTTASDFLGRMEIAMTDAAMAASDEATATREVDVAMRQVEPSLMSVTAATETNTVATQKAAQAQESLESIVRRVTQATNEQNRLYQQSGALIQAAAQQNNFFKETLASTNIVVNEGIGVLPELGRNIVQTGQSAMTTDGIFQGWFSRLKSGFGEMFSGGGSLSSLLGGFFGGAGGGGGILGGIMSGGLAAATNILLPGFGSLMSGLSGLISTGLSKIGGFFKRVFGGPSAEELAGREIVENFQQNMSQILSDTQRIEAGGELWKATNIAVRDAYIEVGLSEQQALADVEALYAAIKTGPTAVNPAIEQIRARMQGLDASIQQTSAAMDNLTRDRSFSITADVNIDVPNVPGLDIPGLASGGVVTKPTLAVVGEAGPEAVVPLNEAGGVIPGAGDMSGVESRLDGLVGEIRSLPRVLARATRDAVIQGSV